MPAYKPGYSISGIPLLTADDIANRAAGREQSASVVAGLETRAFLFVLFLSSRLTQIAKILRKYLLI